MAANVWARAKPGQNVLPPLVLLKSRLFHVFLFIFKNTLKHENPAHIGLEIIYICIHKPFRVQFHCIGALSFVFHLFNEKHKYKGKPYFPDLKIYQISPIFPFGPAIASYVYIGPTPL